MTNHLNKAKTFLIPGALFLVAFFLRLSLISKGPYSGDAIYLVAQASKMAADFHLHYLHHPGYPLTGIIGALFIYFGKLLGVNNAVWLVNFSSVFLSAGCISLNYLLVKELLDESTAFFSSVLLIMNPIFLALSTFGNSHIPNIFFLLMGTYVLMLFFRSGQFRYVIWCGILLGLAGACRIQDLVVFFIPFTFLFVSHYVSSQENKGLKNCLLPIIKGILGVSFFILLTIMIFYVPYIWKLYDPAKRVILPNSSKSIFFLDHFVGLFSYPMQFTCSHFYRTYPILGIVLIILGLIFLWRKSRPKFIFVILWIITPVLLFGTMDILLPRYLTLIIFPLNILMGYTCAFIYRKNLLTKGIIAGVLLLLIIFQFSEIYQKLQFRHDHALLPEFAQWVGKKTPPNARIISKDERLFIERYAKRAIVGRPVGGQSPDDAARMLQFKNKIDHLLKEGIPVYITTVSLYSYDAGESFSRFFKHHYSGELVGRHYYEDYHAGVINLGIILGGLYKINNIDIEPGFSQKGWEDKNRELSRYYLW